MAIGGAVWGIDVGQCALKAIRCRAHDDLDDKVVVEAFDYIEYPKILTQPDAEPDELIAEALKQFLSRNSLKGDKVAISVSGQAGLARFIKLPPVEAKKIPDIVRYEAKQQIPFDLNDVIWDYQRMGGGAEEEGFALETEIGLFAMKREAVFRTLEPFQEAGIEIDFVQLTPLALYNYLLFDRLTDLPPADEYDPDNPPESTVIISLGTDATDLVVTNGFRVWQRSVPIGGNHFTKALTKELKLTFAKAEHLKRNAKSAQDPKAVFQAMRPVFNDMLTELQRSIGYFTSIDRTAKIGNVVALGNTIKLSGLRRYLSQHLGFEVERIDHYRGLTGAEALSAPAFKDNAPCFGVCYGLVLQALGKADLKTNLLPSEIVRDRLIRKKKPWALASAAVLMLGCAISFASHSLAIGGVSEKDEDWQSAERQAQTTYDNWNKLKAEHTEVMDGIEETANIGQNLVANVEGRIVWLELLHAIDKCLPGERDKPRVEETTPEAITERDELHITSLECRKEPDLAAWLDEVQDWLPADESEETAAEEEEAAPEGEEGAEAGGEAWIVTLTGYHYHNPREAGKLQGAEYVRQTLIKNLRENVIELPKGERQPDQPAEFEKVSMEELGISYPVLISPQQIYDYTETDPIGGDEVRLRRFDFTVEFIWKKTPPGEREELREQRESQEEEAEVEE